MERVLKLIVAMQVRMMTRTKDDKGATATEYALLVALIAIIIAVGVGVFGGKLNDFFQAIADTVDGWA
jgi:pilus assembly protein Flp/PilA